MRRTLGMAALTLVLGGCAAGLGGGAGDPGGGNGAGAGTVAVDRADAAPLAFGRVGRVCGLSGRELGAEVDRAPEGGRPRWQLFDTRPGTTEPRTLYITGFDDGCARQITAALAVFGAPATYEATRYGAGIRGAQTETDVAYERIKARLCGVAAGVACPADRLERVGARTAFVTAYPQFGQTSGRQLTLLLNDGALVATSIPR